MTYTTIKIRSKTKKKLDRKKEQIEKILDLSLSYEKFLEMLTESNNIKIIKEKRKKKKHEFIVFGT